MGQGHHRGLCVPRSNAYARHSGDRRAIVEPLRQRTGLKTNSLEDAIDPDQHFAGGVQSGYNFRFKDHSSAGICNAVAGHLERNVQACI